MAEVPDNVDEAIEELSDTPTTDEVFFKTLPFQGREIASAAVSMAAAGGGGGSIPDPVTTSINIQSGPTSSSPLLSIDASDLTSLPDPLEIEGSDGISVQDTTFRVGVVGDVHVKTLANNVTPLELRAPDGISTHRFIVRDASNSASTTIGSKGRLSVQVEAGEAETFDIYDSNGNQIFSVHADGSLHGLTGQSITFDL